MTRKYPDRDTTIEDIHAAGLRIAEKFFQVTRDPKFHCEARPSRRLCHPASPGPLGLAHVSRLATSQSPGSRRGLCDCECIESAGCESLSVVGLTAVTERNCVPVRGCGEHQEVKDWSVG